MLAERGANLDADVYRGTALIWAAAQGKADVDRRGTFGGPRHGSGVTALHLAAQNDCVDVVQILLDAGADPSIRDELFNGTPADWAEHGGSTAALELLRGAN